MRRNRFREYFTQSLAGFGSLAMAIVFFLALYNLRTIFSIFGAVVRILMPMIYGAVIAFILSPLCNRIQEELDKNLKSSANEAQRTNFIKGISVALTVLIALVAIYLVLVLVLPQLFDSIMNLINSMPAISNQLVNWVENALASRPELQEQVMNLSDVVGERVFNWVQNTFMPQLQSLLNGVSVGVLGFFVVLKNLIIGLVISIYLMFNRKLYNAQAKKALYGLLPVKWANWILFLCRDVSDIFSGFIIGKLLDSLIIGVLCFCILSILQFPYVTLISTIVGVTNIIPYFGPFFGAIPSALLVLTVSPLQCLYFLIFILILQQVDGNIIGPKILGNTTGLSSFWVLFSLLLFGGMFGFVGMVIGVPVFAVLYDLAERGIRHLLRDKNLPLESRHYDRMDHIDAETNTIVTIKNGQEK